MTASIPAFPSDIDRIAFGYWLSGFTDGEGCFQLRTIRKHRNDAYYRAPAAGFYIRLRADDGAILRLIQSYWRCGIVNRQYNNDPRTYVRVRNPSFLFRVYPIGYLADILVPHFDRFPLHSKKARDFAIWKEAVLLLRGINLRPVNYIKGLAGTRPKRTREELERFGDLVDALHALRPFDSSLAE